MKTSQAGIDLICHWEGFRSAPYCCSANVWTFGYGSTRLADNSRVTENTPPITKDEAMALLQHQLVQYERAVLRLVPVSLNQSQFDALVSFTYNLGSGSLGSSTLRKKLLKGDMECASKEFTKWSYASGKYIRGLYRRRKDEKNLFLKVMDQS